MGVSQGRVRGTLTLQLLQAQVDEGAEIVYEAQWQGPLLVVAHNPEWEREQAPERRQRIAELKARAGQPADKLDGQDAGVVHRGRKLSDSGAKARFFHEVCEARLASIVKFDLKSDAFV